MARMDALAANWWNGEVQDDQTITEKAKRPRPIPRIESFEFAFAQGNVLFKEYHDRSKSLGKMLRTRGKVRMRREVTSRNVTRQPDIIHSF
jgi:hypothetical protein